MVSFSLICTERGLSLSYCRIELGAALPDHIEVSCPLVHATVHMPVPDGGADWRAVTRDFVIDECSQAMDGSFAWQTVIQMPLLNGRRLELCWKLDTKLDWVWLKDDVDGRKREWEVLFGAALNQVCSLFDSFYKLFR